MRAGPFVALCIAIAGFTGVGFLVRYASELDYQLPNGPSLPAKSLSPRCYELWIDVHDFTRPLPISVQLTTQFVADFGPVGRWYRAEVLRGDSRKRELWRPAGPDSLDIVISDAFKGFRLRIPTWPNDVTGRVLGSYDFGLDRSGTVHAVRSECSAPARLP
jgi:hypothetical protein